MTEHIEFGQASVARAMAGLAAFFAFAGVEAPVSTSVTTEQAEPVRHVHQADGFAIASGRPATGYVRLRDLVSLPFHGRSP
jgi:hypothetical protein